MNPTSFDLPVRRNLPHRAPKSVSQHISGALYFITICINRLHYGIDCGNMVGRVVPNAPSAHPHGGFGTSRPTDAPNATPLTNGNTAIQLLLALENYHLRNLVFPRIAVIMPDHIHFIASFSETNCMTQIVRDWKRWTAREIGIKWQDGFFDHRLRSDSEVAEKIRYIALNPVRKQLCANIEDWPFRMNWH